MTSSFFRWDEGGEKIDDEYDSCKKGSTFQEKLMTLFMDGPTFQSCSKYLVIGIDFHAC